MRFFSKEEEEEIISAIQVAEKGTSGEIRIHVDEKSFENHWERAGLIFNKIGMDKTKDKNGVLFYLNTVDKKTVIIGDENIHKYVKQEFWDFLLLDIVGHFKSGEYKEGLIDVIVRTGEKLRKYFPSDEIKNELPDEISY